MVGPGSGWAGELVVVGSALGSPSLLAYTATTTPMTRTTGRPTASSQNHHCWVTFLGLPPPGAGCQVLGGTGPAGPAGPPTAGAAPGKGVLGEPGAAPP